MPKIRSANGMVRRAPGALLAVALVLSAWAAPIGLSGLGESCAAAAGQVRVWLVVDFGTVPGSPGGVRTMCVTVPDGSTGSAVVQAGVGGLRWNSSGLLCAIGGYPAAPECGDRTSGGYRYWSYWHGGGSWTYSGIGPDGHRVRDGDVEGWHFVSGKGNPTDPPPGAGSSSGCPPPPTTPPPTAAPTRPTTPVTAPPSGPGTGNASGPASGAGGGAPSGSGGNGGATNPGSSGAGTNGGANAGTAGSGGNSSTTAADGGTTTSTEGSDAAGPDLSTGAPEAGAGATDDSNAADGGGSAGVEERTGAEERSGLGKDQEQAALVATNTSSTAPTSSSTGLFIGLGLIALVGGGAYVQFRRRPSLM